MNIKLYIIKSTIIIYLIILFTLFPPFITYCILNGRNPVFYILTNYWPISVMIIILFCITLVQCSKFYYKICKNALIVLIIISSLMLTWNAVEYYNLYKEVKNDIVQLMEATNPYVKEFGSEWDTSKYMLQDDVNILTFTKVASTRTAIVIPLVLYSLSNQEESVDNELMNDLVFGDYIKENLGVSLFNEDGTKKSSIVIEDTKLFKLFVKLSNSKTIISNIYLFILLIVIELVLMINIAMLNYKANKEIKSWKID